VLASLHCVVTAQNIRSKVQGQLRSLIWVRIESDFVVVFTTNLRSILHRLQVGQIFTTCCCCSCHRSHCRWILWCLNTHRKWCLNKGCHACFRITITSCVDRKSCPCGRGYWPRQLHYFCT